MPSSSRARCGWAARTSSGWVNSRSVQPTSSSTLAPQHLGQRLVGVDDPAVVEPHQRHAGRGRLERLLEPPARLVEGTRLLLAVGDVAQPDHQSLLVGDVVARHVERGLDHDLAMVGGVHRELQRFDVVAVEAAADRPPTDRDRRRWPDRSRWVSTNSRRARSNIAERGGVARQHDAFGVDQQHRLGQFVEQPADLGLGRLDGRHPAPHALVLAAQVPHAEPERDHGDDADHHHHLVGPTFTQRGYASTPGETSHSRPAAFSWRRSNRAPPPSRHTGRRSTSGRPNEG